jgi:hypothetical protein
MVGAVPGSIIMLYSMKCFITQHKKFTRFEQELAF